MAKYDLHVHTSYSGDCISPVKEVVKAAKAKGLRGIAITDHDTIRGVEKSRKLSGDELLIIPGIEVTSKDGHILGLGIDESVPKGLPAAETVDRIRELGGIAVAAHPFSFCAKPFVALKAEHDAIEAFNSRRYLANHLVRRFAELKGLPVTAGSDAHRPDEVGLAGLEIGGEPSVDNVLRKIKKKEVSIFGSHLPLRNYASRVIFKILHRGKTPKRELPPAFAGGFLLQRRGLPGDHGRSRDAE